MAVAVFVNGFDRADVIIRGLRMAGIISSSRNGLNMVYLALTKETNAHVQPTDKINRTIRSEQVLEAFVEVVQKNLPLELKHTRITSADIMRWHTQTSIV